jgi:opacity protein-like surface antigen
MLRKYALMAALVLALAPATARADWLFTPNLGTTFGADASGNEHFTYGASIGWMGAGIFGFEGDFSYTPEFFEAGDGDLDPVDNSNVVSWMANTIIGIPIGGQRGGGFRPYVAAGVGVLQREVQSADSLFSINNDEFGFNVGAGAMGFMTDHVGFRGDVRYTRSFEDPVRDNEFDISAGNFDYWRGTAGVTFRW